MMTRLKTGNFSLNDIKAENRVYWAHRSAGYSDINCAELSGSSRLKWRQVLQQQLFYSFPTLNPCLCHVLDIGCGPGFFSILLAELGYQVTAVDLTSEMIQKAKKNAGDYAGIISFHIMDAEELQFESGTFDAILSRNLTWNLPHPETAYREWHRVLKRNGLLLNFDANWYNYLSDAEARKNYEKDRSKSMALGIEDQNVGADFDLMEEIAQKLPLSPVIRPAWDIRVLSDIGFDAAADLQIWQNVWTEQEQINFASTPLFMISAVRK